MRQTAPEVYRRDRDKKMTSLRRSCEVGKGPPIRSSGPPRATPPRFPEDQIPKLQLQPPAPHQHLARVQCNGLREGGHSMQVEEGYLLKQNTHEEENDDG